MYYIKSGSDIFTDFPVTLANGLAAGLHRGAGNAGRDPRRVEAQRPGTHYELHSIHSPHPQAGEGLGAEALDSPRLLGESQGEETRISLKHLKGAQTDRQKDDIVTAARQHCGGDGAEIKRWLNRFIARNQSDFFIHKRLGAALREDLEIFIKTDVLDADQLLAGGDIPQRTLRVARVVRDIGRQIIDFLAALEDFQKTLWEKKKLVFATRYVITLDRIDKLAEREWLGAACSSCRADARSGRRWV
ncbi:MAG: hypothetical protein U1F42_06970 [Candidatus Competibacteraceae bacterium]